MIKKLLLATHNKAKLKELKFGLRKLTDQGVKIITLDKVRLKQTPKETGATFCENAEIKAKSYARQTNIPAVADDGGLIIPYLNNQPGVKSRRWLGYEASDKELIDHTLYRLKDAPQSKKTAYLALCLCFYNPLSGELYYQQDKIKGYIASQASKKLTKGFPFRAIFIVDKLNKHYDELTPQQHNKINHRLTALKKLLPKLEKSLLK